MHRLEPRLYGLRYLFRRKIAFRAYQYHYMVVTRSFQYLSYRVLLPFETISDEPQRVFRGVLDEVQHAHGFVYLRQFSLEGLLGRTQHYSTHPLGLVDFSF